MRTIRVLLIDNYDSYTYNVYQLIAGLVGRPPTVLANDAPRLRAGAAQAYDAVVLSPGPGHPGRRSDIGACADVLLAAEVPVLGVCLGHQIMGHVAGGRIVRLPEPRHGHVEAVTHAGDPLFDGVPRTFDAVRYHSLAVATPVPDDLEEIAWSADGVLMALRHRTRRWWGVQFHPESIASRHGGRLLANFLESAGAGSTGALRDPAGASRFPDPAGVGGADADPFPGAADAGGPATAPAGRCGPWHVHRVQVPGAVDAETAFAALYGDRPHAYWLDSARLGVGGSRFSFLGDSGGPHGELLTFRAGDPGVGRLGADGSTGCLPGDIVEVLSARLAERAVGDVDDLPFDLVGGYVGFFGYELKAAKGWPTRHRAATPDALWMAATRMVAVDHEGDRTWALAVCSGEPAAERAAEEWVDRTARRLRALPTASAPPPPVAVAGTATADGHLVRGRDEYLRDIEACLAELHAGESYEICLTNMARLPMRGSAWAAYRRLRRANPAPYAAYLRSGGLAVLSSSPERYLRVDRDGTVESRPIKGTARRDPDPVADTAVRAALASDAKTFAENLMIVDLVRNDLTRICRPETVSVPGLMHVETHGALHQLVSTVRGRLRDDVDAVRAAWSCFPGGSMTGAPKLRTTEIIDRLEHHPRGVYSGCIGYFGAAGAADLSITIRTAVVLDGEVSVGAGGAIVLASHGPTEYDEMLAKAAAVLQAMPAADDPARTVGTAGQRARGRG